VKKNRVTVTSSGPTGQDAQIVLDDGTILDNVVGATIFIDARELVRVDLEILLPVIAVQAEVTEITYICKVCDGEIEHHCRPDKLSGP
jgi:hypothetical protein